MEVVEIMKWLPHRFPMLMVDRIVELEPGRRAVAIKNVTINEPIFAGHYPDRPIFPGVLIIEAMAQTAGVALLPEGQTAGAGGKVPLLTGVDGVRFRRPVLPGDQLRIEVTALKVRGDIGKVAGKVTVNGETVAEAELMFAWRQME
ncbi:MAG: 3-hydroxyacyl-ACP dehydratase FabZ [Limnochordales bacterium]|nr:3-hydroxyacyl-[acyl-carrier-protein] dehydratase FabZ [Bacillota bacterium]